MPRALLLTPTREPATQVGASFRTCGRHVKLRSAVVYGGVSQKPQVDALARGIDVEDKSYGHRIGRTARAGSGGVAILLRDLPGGYFSSQSRS